MTGSNVIMNALIRKTQIRLMDSNRQSNELANEMSNLLDVLSSNTPPKKNLLEEIGNIKDILLELHEK